MRGNKKNMHLLQTLVQVTKKLLKLYMHIYFYFFAHHSTLAFVSQHKSIGPSLGDHESKSW